MNHLNPGLLAAYNSLTDKHLAGYFSNTRIRRHLQRAGLITRSGRIVPDKEYRHKLLQRAHQRHIRECLAQAIFHKVLEMERLHQIEIKKRLEEFVRKERVHKIRVDRSKRCEEDIIHVLSPHPPTGARGMKHTSGQRRALSESSSSPSSSRPNTAPGKMQRPVRLKPIHSHSTTASARRSSPYRLQEYCHDNDQLFNSTESRRCLATMEVSNGISPYSLPVINNFLTPVPPAMKRKDRGVKVTSSSIIRGRRLRATTASTEADINEDPPWLRSSVHQSRVHVNMVYFGKTLHLSHDLTDMRDEVKVFQQHCGGENLCVYKGKLLEGETFKFISRRHRGFPFSLTFYLNGLQVERLSSCCEFKHRKSSRLGGRLGHFGFSSVEGASPCYKCIIAMGLDKKPTPPPKRLVEDGREGSAASPKNAHEVETEEPSQAHDMQSQGQEQTSPEEDKVRDDYEEDFEAEDEGPAEETQAKEEKSPSPSGESVKKVKEKDTSESEDDEKEDIRSHSGSSFSGSGQEESEAEVIKDEDENQPKEDDREGAAAPAEEKDETDPAETAAAGAESAPAKDSDVQDVAGDRTENRLSDTNKLKDYTSADQKAVEKSKNEEEQENVESVQTRLIETTPKAFQCSSEPELSHTNIQEEEQLSQKDETPENLATCSEHAGVTNDLAQEQEEISETEKQEDAKQEPPDNSDGTKDEKVSEAGEDEKAGEDKATAEEDKLEEQSEARLPLKEENVAQDDKTADAVEEPKSVDTAENDVESQEKSAAEADIQPDETGQRAKSEKEDESSVSEQSKKTDEAAVPHNAEAEAVALSETMEIKAKSSEERDAFSCEEAPEIGTESRQQADSEDRAATETEVTAENSRSLPGEGGDITGEKTAAIREENAKDERGADENKEAGEQTSGAKASMDESQEEEGEQREEEVEKTVEVHEKMKHQKSVEESEQEEKTTCMNSDEREEDVQEREKNKTEEESNDESKTDENDDKKKDFADTITKGEENKGAEKTLDKEDEVVNDENVEEEGKTDQDEDSECTENKKVKGEPESKPDGKSQEGEESRDINIAADEKDDETEKSEEVANEDRVTEIKDVEDHDKEKDAPEKTTGGQEEISEMTEEPEAGGDADLDKENQKLCCEEKAESQLVTDSEAAEETKTTDETQNISEAENVPGKTERSSEKGEIDAENGEISVEPESKAHEGEEEILDEEKTDLKTEDVEERNTDYLIRNDSTDVKEVIVVSGDIAEKLEDSKADQPPDNDVTESDAKEEDNSMPEQHGSVRKHSEPEISGMESKEDPKLDDRKGGEQTEQDEHGNKSDLSHENRDLDFTENNGIIGNINEVAPSEDLEKSSMVIAVDGGGTAGQADEDTLESKTDNQTKANENADEVDLSAADGEHEADTEEASNASEEGASVLFKPLAQNDKMDDTQQTVTVDVETPEALAGEANVDLVTNWINMHQSSKFFETFVEPLEDLREDISNAQASNSDAIETPSTELPRSESLLNCLRMSGDEEEARDEEESFQIKTLQSELESIHGEQSENDPTKATLQREKTEGDYVIPNEVTNQSDRENVKGVAKSEEYKGSSGSLGDKSQDGPVPRSHEHHRFSKTDVESFSGSQHSPFRGKPESITNMVPGLDIKQATTTASLKSEDHHVRTSLDELKRTSETSDKTDKESQQVTEITDFTTSISAVESQDEFHGVEIQRKASEGSIVGERRDVQLIQDIKHTLSKDRLSTFSVDETLFGRTSYPLLTSARTESRH